MEQRFRVINGDSLELLNKLDANSIDSCVCDPPYELGFMGKKWDSTGIANNVELWKSVLRVLKPGAHLIAFGGTRTYHRMGCVIEDAGFEIRDQIGWLYGSGFPKSLDVSKAIDKSNGAKREIIGSRNGSSNAGMNGIGKGGFRQNGERFAIYGDGVTPAAKKWNGWGTALKPAWEPIVLARKPLIGTVAENVQLHGTGAINVDACRVTHSEPIKPMKAQTGGNKVYGQSGRYEATTELKTNGRWPANVIHDGSDEVLAEFAKFGESKSPKTYRRNVSGDNRIVFSEWNGEPAGKQALNFGDTGTAARFFYCAKASKRDRDEGLSGFGLHDIGDAGRHTMSGDMPRNDTSKDGLGRTLPRRNNHPTVKPTALMRYLCKLITPPGGLILDPFTGSGSTGKAAMLEGFRFVGIELSPDYAKIARARISSVCV